MAQFGISNDPDRTRTWVKAPLKDEPLIQSTHRPLRNRTSLFTRQYPKHSNSRGTLTFATSGANTRSCQLFINLSDNEFLDAEGFTPIGRIIYGAMKSNQPQQSDSNIDENVIDRIYAGYGEGGRGDGSDGKGMKASLCVFVVAI